MFISENINISAWDILDDYFCRIYSRNVLVYLQIQMKFAMCGKPGNADQSTE